MSNVMMISAAYFSHLLIKKNIQITRVTNCRGAEPRVYSRHRLVAPPLEHDGS